MDTGLEQGRDRVWSACVEIVLSREKGSVWYFDLQTGKIEPVEGLERYFPLTRPVERLPQSWLESGDIHSISKGDWIGLFSALEGQQEIVSCTVKAAFPLDGYKWVQILAKRIGDSEGAGRAGAVFVSYEMSALMDADRRFFQEEQMRSMLSEDVIAASKVNLTTDRVEYVWGAYVDAQLLEQVQTFEQMYAIGLKSILNEDDRKRYQQLFSYSALLTAFENGKTNLSMEYQYRSPTGAILWSVMSATMLRDPQTNELNYYSFIRDIDEKKRIELMLREKAERDDVTGLYNKPTTELMVREMIRKNSALSGHCALLLLDLDGFKYINEYFGRAYGDTVLAETGRILLNLFGPRAVKGRVGGDEFLVFVEPIPSSDWIGRKAQEFCGELRRIFLEDGSGIQLTGSVGIAFSQAETASFETLYDQADTALYSAKRAGKDRYVVFQNQTRLQEPFGANHCVAKDFLSKNCMLDELTEMVFIIDEESHDLLFMNSAATERLDILNYRGRKCYEVIHGYSRPCLFCRQHQPQEKEYQIWDNINAKLQRRFIIKDKMMHWNGRKARMEIFLDAQELRIQEEMARASDTLLTESADMLRKAQDFSAATAAILERIGGFYGADGAHLLEADDTGERLCVVQKWHAETRPDYQDFQREYAEVPLSAIPRAAEALKTMRPIIFHPNGWKRDTVLYEAPYVGHDTVRGFLGVRAPQRHLEDLPVLETLSYLLGMGISEVRCEEKQHYVDRHDTLTGLLNRKSYLEFIDGIQPDALSSLGVLTADINGLKDYNLEFGPAAGDELLRKMGEILQNCFGSEAGYRISGDEFLVLCRDVASEAFRDKSRQVEAQVERHRAGFAAIGYAWADEDVDFNRILRHAEERMEVSKRDNRWHSSRFGCDPLEEGLQKAVEAGQFALYLQPKVCCDTTVVRGAEALVRYVDPQRGVIPPGKFVPILEERQLIHHVDFFLFEELCKTLRQWEQAGYAVYPISLNFSRATLLQNGLIERMNRISSRYGVRRELLEVEITESFSEMELETLREIGDRIVQSGYRLSLDDFGAKYSNLSVLSVLELNTLKLDKSIVNRLYSSDRVKAVVRNLIILCRELGIQSVAEGVETPEQLAILRELHCDYLQGYLFNKPIPVEAFEQKYLCV